MLGENCFNARERGESLNSNLARRPERVISNDIENDQENTHVNPRVFNSGIVLIWIIIQLLLFLVLRSTSGQVS